MSISSSFLSVVPPVVPVAVVAFAVASLRVLSFKNFTFCKDSQRQSICSRIGFADAEVALFCRSS